MNSNPRGPQTPATLDPVLGRPARAWVGRRPETSADDSFDALTNLFLGEVSGAGPRASAAESLHGESPSQALEASASAGPARPVLRLAGHVDDVLAVAEDARSASPRHDLGEPVVECLTLSNLPVLASAWASQYVREVSAATGRPVGVLRVQSGYASVELVGEWAGEGPLEPGQPAPNLDSALVAAAQITDRWVVRCSPHEQAELAARGMVRVLTVLTGADEAAAAATMQAIRPLRDHLPEHDGPLVRLAVMGAVDDATRAAGAALASSAQGILNRSVQQVVCASKIRSARPPVTLFSGATGLGLAGAVDVLEHVLGFTHPTIAEVGHDFDTPAIVEAAPATAMEHASLAAEPAQVELKPVVEIEDRDINIDVAPIAFVPAIDAGIIGPLSAPAMGSVQIDVLDLPLPAGRVASPAIPEPAPIGAASMETAAIAGGASLMPWSSEESDAEGATASDDATFVHATPPTSSTPVLPATPAYAPASAARGAGLHDYLPGVRALAARCPYAHAVELGVDASNTLHVMVAADAQAQDSALADLLIASSWAATHASLLGVAADARPLLHIFTDAPKRSRRLLDTDVRVHLLAAIDFGGKTVWYSTELN